MKRLNKKGFSMIELLVVLLIIGILAAVAAPMFLANSVKAKASEAVAAVGTIRSAMRVYAMQHAGAGSFADVDGDIYGGAGYTAAATALGVTFNNAKYFSPECYTTTLSATEGAFPANITPPLTATGTVDFVVTADGSRSVQMAAATDGKARNGNDGDLDNIRVKMDNSGVIIYSMDGGANWIQW
jgi:type IV pilus assembly protein PilA